MDYKVNGFIDGLIRLRGNSSLEGLVSIDEYPSDLGATLDRWNNLFNRFGTLLRSIEVDADSYGNDYVTDVYVSQLADLYNEIDVLEAELLENFMELSDWETELGNYIWDVTLPMIKEIGMPVYEEHEAEYIRANDRTMDLVFAINEKRVELEKLGQYLLVLSESGDVVSDIEMFSDMYDLGEIAGAYGEIREMLVELDVEASNLKDMVKKSLYHYEFEYLGDVYEFLGGFDHI